MKKSLTITYKREALVDISDPQILSLIQTVRAALSDSYSPYSKFQVAASAVLSSGQIVSGSNQENAAFPSCLCAEQITLASALAQYPGQTVTRLIVTTSSEQTDPAAPCGNCRQVISEIEYRQQTPLELMLLSKTHLITVDSASTLLPMGFERGHF